jgi:protein O-GlcNAc transferase
MKPRTRRILSGLVGTVVVLIASGCADRHTESINSASARWMMLRSTQMLALAHQQFEAGDLELAEKSVAEALSVDQTNADLLVLASRICLEQGHLERSYHLLNKAIENDPQLAEAQYYKGLVMQRWRQFDAALICYQHAYGLEADNVAYLLAVSEMLVAMDRVDEAIELLESKLTYFEQNVGIREAIGRLHVIRRRFELAVDYFERAQLLQPDDVQLREELAMARMGAGQYAEAAQELKELCEQLQDDDRRYLRVALITAYQAIGRLDAAREVCFEMTRRNPEDTEAWRRLADLSWEQEDLTAALTAAGRMCKLAPERPDGYLMAGMVWQKRGNSKRALELFQAAAKADRTSAKPAMLQGIALEQDGQLAAAAEAYREALRREPNDARARKLLAGVEARL